MECVQPVAPNPLRAPPSRPAALFRKPSLNENCKRCHRKMLADVRIRSFTLRTIEMKSSRLELTRLRWPFSSCGPFSEAFIERERQKAPSKNVNRCPKTKYFYIVNNRDEKFTALTYQTSLAQLRSPSCYFVSATKTELRLLLCPREARWKY
jgi:hypothetical protein